MAFSQPALNITFNVWRHGLNTAITPPTIAGLKGNLTWGRRVSSMSTGGTESVGLLISTMTLLMESTADVRDQWSTTLSDTVEVPAGSGRFYVVWTCDYIGLGFDNEHKGAVIVKAYPFKTPDA